MLRKIIFLLLLACLTASFTVDKIKKVNLQKLWYTNPAERWEEALPLGNGRLGAMVFGSPELEHLQLNEETVWAGEPGNNIPKGFSEVLPQVRKLIFEEKYKEAEVLAMSKVPRKALADNNYGMPYQTVGDLWINFPALKNVSNYYRELDLQNAISSVTFEKDGTRYKREYFASAIDQVIVVRLTASKKEK